MPQKIIFLTSALLFFLIPKVAAVVLHPDGEPNLATWTDRPDSNVVGSWSYNASFAVIAPNWAITTRHQNTSPSTVSINGISYDCTFDNQWAGGPSGNADIRLIRLTKSGKGAGLKNYASAYSDSNEIGKQIVIGGFGNSRGANLTTFYHGQYVTYGYQWDGSANTILRWGQNRIDGIDIGTGTYTSNVIFADFDGLGDVNSTDYECIVAVYDSGGGWFIYDDNHWKLAGLSRGVEHANECWFRNKIIPTEPDPDYMDAVRISSYAQWINGIILTPGDLDKNNWVDFDDFALFAKEWLQTGCDSANDWCDGADFQPHDGNVDWNDLNFLAMHWLTGWNY